VLAVEPAEPFSPPIRSVGRDPSSRRVSHPRVARADGSPYHSTMTGPDPHPVRLVEREPWVKESVHSQCFIDAAELTWLATEPGVERQVLAHDATVMMVRVRFAAGAVGALHQHPHRQVSYVAAGSFEVQIGEQRKVLRSGDSFIIPPDTVHGVVAREPGMLIDVFSPAREEFIAG
jgi:quercetin dioxygenase-like cupin family protein